MIVTPRLAIELHETFYFVYESDGLDAAIEAVAKAGSAYLRSEVGLTIPKVIQAVALSYGVTVHEIRQDIREKAQAGARQACMWILRHLGHTYQEIGAAIGRDHKTVFYGIRAIEHDVKRRDRASKLLEELRAVS
jgi:chromosomal replication initiation ATPase DnaA